MWTICFGSIEKTNVTLGGFLTSLRIVVYTVYLKYMRAICFISLERTDVTLGVYLNQQCSVHCLLELSICLYLGTDVTLGVY